jgi:hypothetical protein
LKGEGDVSKVEKIINVLLLMLASIFGLLMVYRAIDSFLFDRECAATVGMIYESYEDKGGRFGPAYAPYSVQYTFQYKGVTYTGRDILKNKPLISMTPVYFLTDKPEKNKIERGLVLESLFLAILSAVAARWLYKRV